MLKKIFANLFDRKNGKLFLNEQGRTFLAHVERVLQELDDGVASVTESDGSISGSVRIKVMENHNVELLFNKTPLLIKVKDNSANAIDKIRLSLAPSTPAVRPIMNSPMYIKINKYSKIWTILILLKVFPFYLNITILETLVYF